VIIVHSEASCGWGGQEIRIIEESLGMLNRGYQVNILCPPESRIYSEAPKQGVAVVALPIGRKNFKGFWAMRRWLQLNPVDILNTHSSTDSWLAALACATLDCSPAIVRTRHISAPVANNSPTRWLYTRATRHIVTTGEALRQSLIKDNGYPSEMLTSVPTGIDPQRFSPADKVVARQQLGLAPQKRYIGIVATLRSWKGHRYLVEAFSRMTLSNWHLLIVGDGPKKEEISHQVESLGLQERVTLVGQQSNPEAWFRCLDLFCLPSYANEGVPQAVLQAMMTGLPIVSTTAGAISEVVIDGKTGLIVPPCDVAALQTALTKLATDSVLCETLGGNAIEIARNHYTREAMLDQMESIFQGSVG
jgi:glycosyltransferase involved in cell wall biosynthesis